MKRVPGLIAPALLARFQSWAAERRGVTAIEFALIALPFFIMIFGLLELCMVFIGTTMLEFAVQEASRHIRTGELGAGGQAAFTTSVCNNLVFMNCGRVSMDVRSFTNFSTVNIPPPIDASGNFNPSGFTFNAGGPEEIVVATVYYDWQLITPGLTAPLANMGGNRRLLQATAAFRNEPYQ